MLAACTSMTTTPGPATGSGKSSYLSSAGPPYRSMKAAFIGLFSYTTSAKCTRSLPPTALEGRGPRLEDLGVVLGWTTQRLWHGPEFPHRSNFARHVAAWRMSAGANRSAFARRVCRGGPESKRRKCPRKYPHLDRQEHTTNVGFRGWRAALSLGGLDRPRRLRHAERHVSAATNGKNVVFEGVLQFAHAAFDLLPRRLRDPRQLRDPSPRRPRFPWLHQAASRERRYAVRPGQAEGNERHDHCRFGRSPVVRCTTMCKKLSTRELPALLRQ